MSNTRTPRTVRLTDSEVAELRAVAQPLGIGWTQFLRWAALTAVRKHRSQPVAIVETLEREKRPVLEEEVLSQGSSDTGATAESYKNFPEALEDER